MNESPHPSSWKRIALDPQLRGNLLLRAAAIRATREWFWRHGCIELDPPVLAPWAPMETHLDPLRTTVTDGFGSEMLMYHQTSPEYALKKLLAAGMPDCFALGHVFRDGEATPMHEPEFTLVEWYRRDSDYTAIMQDTEEYVADLACTVATRPGIEWNGIPCDLSPPWRRITVAEAMHRWTNVDILSVLDDAEAFRAHARERGHCWVSDESWEDLFFKLFITDVEPHLGHGTPVILYEYPASMAALARRKPSDGRVAERFEAYICGVELCNAFSELTDPAEQRRRFEAERAERRRLGREEPPIDEDLLSALASLPDCAGNALGFDRLLMLLTGETGIARVIPFPFRVMRDAWLPPPPD